MKLSGFALIFSMTAAGIASAAHAQEGTEGSEDTVAASPAPQNGRVRLFLDCQRCDVDFLRTEIDFVDYVRDRQDSDVHLLVTTQPTGVGGMEYAMQFVGLGRFQGLTDELRYTSTVTNSQDQVRRGMARVMVGGLVRYAMRTPLAQRLELNFGNGAAGEAATATATGESPVRDRWNQWVFRTSLGGSLNKEASYNSLNINASASANRITAAWKTTLSVSTRTSESETKVRDNVVTNEQRDHSINTLVVKSINDHWSVGARSNTDHSTFQNRDLALRLAPAIEYNIFPYSESTRRQLTLQYSIGANQIAYLQETIYDRMNETLVDHALNVAFDTRQTWGSGNLSVEGSQYVHDPSKFRLDVDGGVDLQIYRGISLNLNGSAQRIHDQLHLVKGDLSDEQILLRQRQIATNFRYNFFVGLGYSFGSIFTGTVNPRLGNAGAGGGGGGGAGGLGGGGGGGGGGGRRN